MASTNALRLLPFSSRRPLLFGAPDEAALSRPSDAGVVRFGDNCNVFGIPNFRSYVYYMTRYAFRRC